MSIEFNKIDKDRLLNGIYHKLKYYKATNTGGLYNSLDRKFSILNRPNALFPYYSFLYITKKYGKVLFHTTSSLELLYVKVLEDDLIVGGLLNQHEKHTLYFTVRGF